MFRRRRFGLGSHRMDPFRNEKQNNVGVCACVIFLDTMERFFFFGRVAIRHLVARRVRCLTGPASAPAALYANEPARPVGRVDCATSSSSSSSSRSAASASASASRERQAALLSLIFLGLFFFLFSLEAFLAIKSNKTRASESRFHGIRSD